MNPLGKSRKAQAGQSVLECALVLPLLLLLILNVVNFGSFLYAWISVANGARTGAQYFTAGGVSVGGATAPAAATVQTLVKDDLKSLPNQASIQICVSTSNTTVVRCNQGTAPAGTPPAADRPEGEPAPGVIYLIGAVDVTYTYEPIIKTWDFPGLNIHLTLPPTTLHRQTKMRVLQ